MKAEKKVFGRVSIFDKKILPVLEPAKVIRSWKKRLGMPLIIHLSKEINIYRWHIGLDMATIIVVNKEGYEFNKSIGTRF